MATDIQERFQEHGGRLCGVNLVWLHCTHDEKRPADADK